MPSERAGVLVNRLIRLVVEFLFQGEQAPAADAPEFLTRLSAEELRGFLDYHGKRSRL